MADESQYLSFHGIRVHFRVAEPEETPNERVLIVSSPLTSGFHWRKVVPELTQMGALVVLADLPGFGKSDCCPSVPQDHLMRANILWGILDEIDRSYECPLSAWHLVAHASACPAILEMAALYPESVKSQVHVAPLMTVLTDNNKYPQPEWFRQTIYEPENFRRMVEHYAGYPMDDYIIDRMRAPLLRAGAQRTFLQMLAAGRKPPSCGIGFCPAMVLIGGRDAMCTPAARAQIKKYLSEAETHVLKSAGHFPMETHSRALRDYLRGWIRYNA